MATNDIEKEKEYVGKGRREGRYDGQRRRKIKPEQEKGDGVWRRRNKRRTLIRKTEEEKREKQDMIQ